MLAAASPRSAISAVVEEEKEKATGGKEEEEEEEENASLLAAAHELRRSLIPPHQSLFRVVCILVYEDFAGNLHRITGESLRKYSRRFTYLVCEVSMENFGYIYFYV